MKIRLLSDLHLEFYDNPKIYATQGEDVLVLAGDVHAGIHKTATALTKFYAQQKNIVYLPGNHEYYGTSIAEFDHAIGNVARDLGICLLNPGMVKLGSVTFIGATLWTNFGNNPVAAMAAAQGINDFRHIKGFNTSACTALYNSHEASIKSNIAATSGTKVVVSHFLPAVECIAPEYAGPDLINRYFANDLGNYISTLTNTIWLFGHTHTVTNKTIGTTHCIANPYGYYANNSYKECMLEV
jgi:predicted phosphodiesterase